MIVLGIILALAVVLFARNVLERNGEQLLVRTVGFHEKMDSSAHDFTEMFTDVDQYEVDGGSFVSVIRYNPTGKIYNVAIEGTKENRSNVAIYEGDKEVSTDEDVMNEDILGIIIRRVV